MKCTDVPAAWTTVGGWSVELELTSLMRSAASRATTICGPAANLGEAYRAADGERIVKTLGLGIYFYVRPTGSREQWKYGERAITGDVFEAATLADEDGVIYSLPGDKVGRFFARPEAFGLTQADIAKVSVRFQRQPSTQLRK